MPKVIFITGISSGFGKSMAGMLAERGHRVYGTMRQPEEAAQGISVLKMDLMDKTSVQEAVQQVLTREGRIDVVINNAGMHTGGSVETTPADFARQQLETNIFGTVEVLRNVLPAMRAQKTGTIINFSSIGGLMGLPFQGFYSASKFAIEGLSEALRMELKPYNIKVVVINPGDFHTHNTQNRRKFMNTDPADPYAAQFSKSLSVIESDENGGLPPEKLAARLVKIAECSNPCYRYVIATLEQKLAIMLKRLLPESMFAVILGSHYGIK